MRLLAIDPGTTESAYVVMDENYKPIEAKKLPNADVRQRLLELNPDHVFIELIGHYGTGMPAGQTVFDTCIWIGRFVEILLERDPELVKRVPVKVHHCGSPRAKDTNVRQALVDRFTPNAPNMGKGTRAKPGWFYGFRADVWQAYAVGVYGLDKIRGKVA